MALIRRAVVSASALILVVSTPLQPVAAADGNTSLRVENASLDLGTVSAGETVEATFVFHNDGPEDVHIIRARPS
jgi:hypothetical protein